MNLAVYSLFLGGERQGLEAGVIYFPFSIPGFIRFSWTLSRFLQGIV